MHYHAVLDMLCWETLCCNHDHMPFYCLLHVIAIAGPSPQKELPQVTVAGQRLRAHLPLGHATSAVSEFDTVLVQLLLRKRRSLTKSIVGTSKCSSLC